MAEYIERSAILKKQTTMTEYDEGGWDAEVKVVRVEDIEKVPTADVVEVVHSHYAHDPITGIAYCAECQMDAVEDGTNYCPNCGARMDGDNP